MRMVFRAGVASILMLLASPALALELSLLSGALQSENSKSGGDDAGGKTTISVGARVAEPAVDVIQYFFEGGLTLRSYDAGKDEKAPSNSTGITLLGGARYYFVDFSQSVTPYVQVAGGYIVDKDGESAPNKATETELSGLIYRGHVGLRLEVDPDFFIDIETQVFDSMLFGSEKTKGDGIDQETSKTELYAASGTRANLLATTIGIGMRL